MNIGTGARYEAHAFGEKIQHADSANPAMNGGKRNSGWGKTADGSDAGRPASTALEQAPCREHSLGHNHRDCKAVAESGNWG